MAYKPTSSCVSMELYNIRKSRPFTQQLSSEESCALK